MYYIPSEHVQGYNTFLRDTIKLYVDEDMLSGGRRQGQQGRQAQMVNGHGDEKPDRHLVGYLDKVDYTQEYQLITLSLLAFLSLALYRMIEYSKQFKRSSIILFMTGHFHPSKMHKKCFSSSRKNKKHLKNQKKSVSKGLYFPNLNNI